MLKSLIKKLMRNRRGAAFVEYALLVGGIALVGAAAVAVFGHKTSDMLGAAAAIIPGAHFDDNSPMASGKLIETNNTSGVNGDAIGLDVAGAIKTNSDGTKDRLGLNLTGVGTNNGLGGLVEEVQ